VVCEHRARWGWRLRYKLRSLDNGAGLTIYCTCRYTRQTRRVGWGWNLCLGASWYIRIVACSPSHAVGALDADRADHIIVCVWWHRQRWHEGWASLVPPVIAAPLRRSRSRSRRC